jgi:hypothetical protein
MPLTAKGEEILAQMKEQYGEEKGERVFYAAKNKGTITGVDAMKTRAKDVTQGRARVRAGGGGGDATVGTADQRHYRPAHLPRRLPRVR